MPVVRVLTIGQVGFEEGRGRYMCEETGIGSGTLYYDETLFSTHKEADVEAKKICDAQTKNVARNNFKGKYDFADLTLYEQPTLLKLLPHLMAFLLPDLNKSPQSMQIVSYVLSSLHIIGLTSSF